GSAVDPDAGVARRLLRRGAQPRPVRELPVDLPSGHGEARHPGGVEACLLPVGDIRLGGRRASVPADRERPGRALPATPPSSPLTMGQSLTIYGLLVSSFVGFPLGWWSGWMSGFFCAACRCLVWLHQATMRSMQDPFDVAESLSVRAAVSRRRAGGGTCILPTKSWTDGSGREEGPVCAVSCGLVVGKSQGGQECRYLRMALVGPEPRVKGLETAGGAG